VIADYPIFYPIFLAMKLPWVFVADVSANPWAVALDSAMERGGLKY